MTIEENDILLTSNICKAGQIVFSLNKGNKYRIIEFSRTNPYTGSNKKDIVIDTANKTNTYNKLKNIVKINDPKKGAVISLTEEQINMLNNIRRSFAVILDGERYKGKIQEYIFESLGVRLDAEALSQ